MLNILQRLRNSRRGPGLLSLPCIPCEMAAPSAIVTSSELIYSGRTAQNGVTRELKPPIGNIVPCPIPIGVVSVVVNELAPLSSILPMVSTLLSPSVLANAFANVFSPPFVLVRSLVAELNMSSTVARPPLVAPAALPRPFSVFPRLVVAVPSVAAASATDAVTLLSRGPSRSLQLAPTLSMDAVVRRVSPPTLVCLVAALSIPVLTPLVSLPSVDVRLPSRATAALMPAPRRLTVPSIVLGSPLPVSSVLSELQTRRQSRVRPSTPAVRPCNVPVAPLVRAFVPLNRSLILVLTVAKSPVELARVAFSVAALAPNVFARLLMLSLVRPSAAFVSPVPLSIPVTRLLEDLSRRCVSRASASNAWSALEVLASALVKLSTPLPNRASRLRVVGPLSRPVSRDVISSVASASALENALPIRVSIALVFRFATPGVKVPPPLPPQQVTLVRLLLDVKNATTWASKPPGTIIVVQHPLDPALPTVLPPAAKA